MNNLTDATSSIVTMLGFKLAEKPADEDHPYGHARFEYLSGLAVAALIIVIGVELAKSSFDKILHPAAVSFGALPVIILVLSVAVKVGLWLFNGELSKLIRSTTLMATAQDSRNDAIATGAVLVAGLVEYFTGAMIDGWMGAAVALFILYSGAMLAKETINPLLGESASPELQERIVDYVRSQPKVLGFHDLMVHDYGPGQRFATLHVEMDRGEDPLTCHELIDDMERECYQNHGIHLVIHYDPVITDDPELTRFRSCCEELLGVLDKRLHLHDFRMVQGDSHTNLIFDVALPSDMAGRESEIVAHLEGNLSRQEGKRIYVVITFDPEAFNMPVTE
jgi:cation diffusion facilitator family transporter